jgi:methionyl aminopeptidase
MEENEINSYKKAGKIADEIKKELINFVKPNIKLLDIANFIENKIYKQNAVPAFPTNLSINEIAAHYTPIPNDTKEATELIKIDFGVCVNGFIADTSISFDLSESKKYEEMIELNKKILKNITNILSLNSQIKDIGEMATNTLEEYNKKNKTNYKLIHSLCGHGLGENLIHTGPTIPNYKNSSTKKLPNSGFAIEPFVTTGVGDIYEGIGGNIFCINSENIVRDRDARKLLDYIKINYKTRPFCERWLVNAGFTRTRYLLKLLEQNGTIYQYPLLLEKGKEPVSQVENTFICTENEVFCTTEL